MEDNHPKYRRITAEETYVYSFLKHSEKTEEEHLNPSKIL
jgi:hypothetical protein